MAEGERERVVVTDSGGGRGGGTAIAAVVLLIAVVVVLFLLFGRGLLGGQTTDVKAKVNIDAPAAGGSGS